MREYLIYDLVLVIIMVLSVFLMLFSGLVYLLGGF